MLLKHELTLLWLGMDALVIECNPIELCILLGGQLTRWLLLVLLLLLLRRRRRRRRLLPRLLPPRLLLRLLLLLVLGNGRVYDGVILFKLKLGFRAIVEQSPPANFLLDPLAQHFLSELLVRFILLSGLFWTFFAHSSSRFAPLVHV